MLLHQLSAAENLKQEIFPGRNIAIKIINPAGIEARMTWKRKVIIIHILKQIGGTMWNKVIIFIMYIFKEKKLLISEQ